MSPKLTISKPGRWPRSGLGFLDSSTPRCYPSLKNIAVSLYFCRDGTIEISTFILVQWSFSATTPLCKHSQVEADFRLSHGTFIHKRAVMHANHNAPTLSIFAPTNASLNFDAALSVIPNFEDPRQQGRSPGLKDARVLTTLTTDLVQGGETLKSA